MSRMEVPGHLSVSMVVSLPDDVGSLIAALTVFKDAGIHPEFRPTNPDSSSSAGEGKAPSSRDYFLECRCTQTQLDKLTAGLKAVSLTVRLLSQRPDGDTRVPVMSSAGSGADHPWFPRSPHELYHCLGNIYKHSTEFAADHPGFDDPVYKERRKEIAAQTCDYQFGDPIPRVEYSQEEIQVWGQVFRNQTPLFPTHACKEYNEHAPALFEACGYREDNIPQLADISQYLEKKTGWQLWPIVGWLPPRDFMAAMAFKFLPATQHIRPKDNAFYNPEPDICHERLGHIPLFCDENFARFSQELGLASLGASDEWIDKLSNLGWFTSEFGMVREDGKLKAYGGGILSSHSELKRCVTSEPEHRDLDLSEAAVQPYPEDGNQPLYYVAASMDSMKEMMIEFAKTIPRPFTVHYNASTRSVEVTYKSA